MVASEWVANAVVYVVGDVLKWEFHVENINL